MTGTITTRPLSGHTSPESAYNVEDYPYGFRLRTTIRYWVETKKGHGQRMVSQTLNPKTKRWNKPKASTYAPVVMMALDEQDHVVNQGLSEYAGSDELELWALWAQRHLTEWQIGSLDYLRAIRRAAEHITVTAHICQPGCTEDHQTREEQNQLVGRAVAHEMRRNA